MDQSRSPAICALDLGNSSGRLLVGTLENDRLSVRELHRFDNCAAGIRLAPVGGKQEAVEECFWDEMALHGELIAGLRKAARDREIEIKSFGIDTWGSDGAFLNARGDMLGRVHCCRDHRLDAVPEEIQQVVDERWLYRETGAPLRSVNLLSQLFWTTRYQPELVAQAATFMPIGSLFYYYLCGVRFAEYTWMSWHQLMTVGTRRYSEQVFTRLDLPLYAMPPIVEPGTELGAMHAPLARELGMEEVKLIATALHDSACAFLAAPSSHPRQSLIISSGTWSLTGQVIPGPITSDEAFHCGMVNEGGVEGTMFVRDATCTWLLQELRRVWAARDGRTMDWEEMSRSAALAPAFAVLFDPDDPSLQSPADMESAIRELCIRTGQPVPRTRGGYVRAVLESLALAHAIRREHIERITGNTFRDVHVIGGGARDDILNQWTADSLGLPVIAGPAEATAIGNILVQAMSLGMVDSPAECREVVRRSFPQRTFEPRDTDRWSEALERMRRSSEVT